MYLENYYVSKSYEIDHPFIQKNIFFRKFKGQMCEKIETILIAKWELNKKKGVSSWIDNIHYEVIIMPT
jgi:hypothetical protein